MRWKLLFKIDQAIGKVEVVLLSVILIGIIILYSIQTVLRNGGPFIQTTLGIEVPTAILWIDPLVLHSMLWIMMLGGSVATLDQRHMNIDLFSKVLPKKYTHFLLIFISLAAAVVIWFFADAAVDFITLVKEDGSMESVYLPIPQWISKMIIPVGFYLIMVRFVLRAFEHALILRGVDIGLPLATQAPIKLH